MINLSYCVFFNLFISRVRLIQKDWTTTRVLRDAFENLSSEQNISSYTIVTDVLIWNQPAAWQLAQLVRYLNKG